jgi:hypothetical protein
VSHPHHAAIGRFTPHEHHHEQENDRMSIHMPVRACRLALAGMVSGHRSLRKLRN